MRGGWFTEYDPTPGEQTELASLAATPARAARAALASAPGLRRWTVYLYDGRELVVEAERLQRAPDGSLLSLDNDSRLGYPTSARMVSMKGRWFLFQQREGRVAKMSRANQSEEGSPWKQREDTVEIWANNLDRATDHAWLALRKANAPDDASEFIFRHGDVPSRLEHNDGGRLVPQVLRPDRMRYRLSQLAIWKMPKADGKVRVLTGAPGEIVINVLAAPDPPLPVLDRVVDVPVLGPDGKIHDKPGYSSSSRVFYEPAEGLSVPKVASRPSKSERLRARKLITYELFGDFPFVGKSELAHAVAMLLQPFVRAYFSGPTPLYVVEAPTPGTGKGLLVEVACWPAVGAPLPAMTEGKDEDEWRKRITANLVEAPVAILIDNLKDKLDSASVSAVLTADIWKDRILGRSAMCTLPNKTTWVATGNNPDFSKEIARRVARIRMDAGQEHPEDRKSKDFRHEKLVQYAAEHRGELVWAALTLARAWVAAGAKPGEQNLGSFEAWSACLGGILKHAGIGGFLGNVQELRDSSQSDSETMHAFLLAWFEFHGETPVKARDIGHPADVLGIDWVSDKGKTALGRLCAAHKDRRYGDLILRQSGRRDGVAVWQVLRAEAPK
jgi:putative DNA primase/helicase